MPDIILTNVKLCTGGTVAREGVANSGRIVGVSDRVDLRVNDTQPLQSRTEAIKLDGQRVDGVNPSDVGR